MSDQDRKSCYEKEDDVYGPNNNNSLYSNGTLHYCSIYRYVVGLFNVDIIEYTWLVDCIIFSSIFNISCTTGFYFTIIVYNKPSVLCSQNTGVKKKYLINYAKERRALLNIFNLKESGRLSSVFTLYTIQMQIININFL